MTIELHVYTHNNKLKGKNVCGNGIVKFSLSQKKKAYQLFLKYMETAGKYGKPFISLVGRKDIYIPDFDGTPSKYALAHGHYAGKFSWESMFEEWIEEYAMPNNSGGTAITGVF